MKPETSRKQATRRSSGPRSNEARNQHESGSKKIFRAEEQ
jgi:hypothetical protein